MIGGDNVLHSGETIFQDLEFAVDGFLSILLLIHSLLLGLKHRGEFGKRAAFRVDIKMCPLALVQTSY